MAPTIADMLALPALADGAPEVLAGHDALDRPVRWVHVSDLLDVGPLLQGRELILTTGVALPDEPARLAAYVGGLVEAGVSGVVLELGRRFPRAPRPLVRAAERAGLPLVVLRREVPFVEVTRAAHELIVDARFTRLARAERVHALFTSLSVEGGTTDDVLRHTVELTGCSVVLENLAHQVLAHRSAGLARAALLRGWEKRSRAATAAGTTGAAVVSVLGEEWLVVPVGARGEMWGRLVLTGDGPAHEDHRLVLECAAGTLAMNRLAARGRESLESHAHRTLLTDLLHGEVPTEEDVHAQTAALGVPTARRPMLAVVVRTDPPQPDAEDVRAGDDAEAVSLAVRGAGLKALVAPLRRGETGVLLPLGAASERRRVLERLAAGVHDRFARPPRPRRAWVGVGPTTSCVAEVRRSFTEAGEVAASVRGTQPSKPYYELQDIRLGGLLHLLRDDPRVQAFVERELGPLVAYDAEHGTDLVEVLRALLEQGGNKSAAADALHMSRPALYTRVRTAERVLGVDLQVPGSAVSLHVALLALDAVRR